jgi:hypothetical protein
MVRSFNTPKYSSHFEVLLIRRYNNFLICESVSDNHHLGNTVFNRYMVAQAKQYQQVSWAIMAY